MHSENRSSIVWAGRILIAIGIVTILALPAAAQSVPTVMNYQGRLTDNTPLQDPIDATLPMVFRIYGSQMGSDLLWSESWPGVQVVDGIFSMLLGNNGSPIDPSVFTSGAVRYLELEINGEILLPRQRIGVVGFSDQSSRAKESDSAEDLSCLDCVDATEVEFNYATSDSEGGPATNLAGDSVGAAQIQADAVRASEIMDGEVGNSKLSLSTVGLSGISTTSTTPLTLVVQPAGEQQFCALSNVQMNTIVGSAEDIVCQVWESGGLWYLSAKSNGTTLVRCGVICF